jgi:hypothetical protein
VEATRLACRLGREVKGKEGSDVGGFAILEDLAVGRVVTDCACPDLVQGSDSRLDDVGACRIAAWYGGRWSWAGSVAVGQRWARRLAWLRSGSCAAATCRRRDQSCAVGRRRGIRIGW